jgi:predicted GIY-YIG superfamily endonuclease
MLIAPIPRLRVTKSSEQALVLLLTLYQLGEVESVTAVADYIRSQNYWRKSATDWATSWQEQCLKQQYIQQTNGRYRLSQRGLNRLRDLCTLAVALPDAGKRMATPAAIAADHVRKEIGGRPFANTADSQRSTLANKQYHYVYVILLEAAVIDTFPRLLDLNPARNTRHACLYVGYTSRTPEDRFMIHKRGYKQASHMVMRYGLCLVPDLYSYLNPIMNLEQAITAEKQMAQNLRRQGYTVSAGHHDWDIEK